VEYPTGAHQGKASCAEGEDAAVQDTLIRFGLFAVKLFIRK
jgi:hypothetical protein